MSSPTTAELLRRIEKRHGIGPGVVCDLLQLPRGCMPQYCRERSEASPRTKRLLYIIAHADEATLVAALSEVE